MIRFVNKKVGRFGNSLFQLFFAEYLSRKFPNLEVMNFELLEFGINQTKGYSLYLNQAPEITLTGHSISAEELGIIQSNRTSLIHSEVIGMQMRFLDSIPNDISKLVSELRQIEDQRECRTQGKVLCHIRGGDIWRKLFIGSPVHPDYSSLPYSYYLGIQEAEGLDLVFLLEPGVPQWYKNGLVRKFGKNSVLPTSSVRSDFALLLKSSNLAISISSFSWMAGFLGTGKRIHYPVHGLLSPSVRSDLDLMPIKDERYVFYYPEAHIWRGGLKDYKWIYQSELELPN
jgi:hypothetical protein